MPAGERRTVKAVTLVSAKWSHLARPGGPVLVRASVGRAGEPPEPDDDRLTAGVLADLGRLLGTASRPESVPVERWPDAMPQYVAGHGARVAALDAALAAHPRVQVAGAGFRGVGVPACIRSGRQAADRVAEAIRLPTAPDLAR